MHINAIREVLAKAARQDAERELTELEIQALLLDAHRSGLTWTAIADEAGLASGNAARMRAQPGLDKRTQRQQTTGKSYVAPGLSVAAAAKHLGCTPKTVYARIDRGDLRSTTDRAGRTRVLLDDQQDADD